MKTVLVVLAVLGSAGGLIGIAGVVMVVGMRTKARPVLNAVRRMNRVTKRLVLKSAGGTDSPTAVISHVGRTSGRAYDTPVVAAPVEDGFVIALPYGRNTDWLKNVLAGGRTTVTLHGQTSEVESPEVVEIRDVSAFFGRREQRLQRQFGVRDALRLQSSGRRAAETQLAGSYAAES